MKSAQAYLSHHKKHEPGKGQGHGIGHLQAHAHGPSDSNGHGYEHDHAVSQGHKNESCHYADVLPFTTADAHHESSGPFSCFLGCSRNGSRWSPCCNAGDAKSLMNLAEDLKSLSNKNRAAVPRASTDCKKLPHGSVLAAGLHGTASESQEDSMLALWTPHDPNADGLLNKNPDCILEHHKNRVLCLAADREWALSGSESGELHYWDLVNKKCLGTLYGHEGHAQSIVADFEQNWAVSCSGDKSLIIWDLTTLFPLHTILDTTVVLGVSADFGIQKAATAGHDGRLKVWNLSIDLNRDHHKTADLEKRARKEMSKERQKECHEMEKRTSIENCTGSHALAYDVTANRKRGSVEHLQCDLDGHDDHATDVEACFVEGKALTCSRDGTLRFWDVERETCLLEFSGHEHPIHSVSADFKTHRALSASADATLKIWDLKGKSTCTSVLKEHESTVNAISADFNQHRAVSGSSDRSVKEWDLRREQSIRTLGGFNHGVQAVCLL